jgi:hypothetical protein
MFNKIVKKKIKLDAILFFIFVLLSIFDQMRESLPIFFSLNKFFAAGRDLLILLFFTKYYNKFKVFNNMFVLLVFILSVISLVIGFFYSRQGVEVIREYWCYLKLLFLYFILKHMKEITGVSKKTWVKIFVSVVILFAIINIYIFLNFSYLLIKSFYVRATVGNSSIVSYIYITAIICILFHRPFKITIINDVAFILLFISILLTVTTTANIALVFVLLINFISLTVFNKLRHIVLLVVLCCTLVFTVNILEINKIVEYILIKGQEFISIVSLKNVDIFEVGTMSTRELQINKLFKNMVPYNYLFGFGFNGFDMIENQFATLLSIAGIFGLLFFLYPIINSLILALFNKNYFAITVFIVFLCYCMTLVMFLAYALGFCFVFLLSLIDNNKTILLKQFYPDKIK